MVIKRDKEEDSAPEKEDLLDSLPKFTPKQRQFIDHYVISMNATDACKKAGYDTPYYNRIGSQLLSKPHIRAEIERIIRKSIEDDGEINAEFVKNGIKKTIYECKNPRDKFIGYELLAKCVPGVLNPVPEQVSTINFTNIFAKIDSLSQNLTEKHDSVVYNIGKTGEGLRPVDETHFQAKESNTQNVNTPSPRETEDPSKEHLEGQSEENSQSLEG